MANINLPKFHTDNTYSPKDYFNPMFMPEQISTSSILDADDTGSDDTATNKLSSSSVGLAGGAIAGAIGGIVGGIQDNSAIRSQNNAINRSQGLLRGQIDDLKRQRLDSVGYRRNEANDFLANYAVLRDPNKSGQMAQMYSSGQERFRSELGQNDQNQLALNSQISELERQKQKEKSGLEIFGQSIAGAANSALQLAPYALMG